MSKRSFKDLAGRKKVWIALSDLFLDTDTTIFHENIITELSASTYSIKELKKIMLFEVYPVCRWNLLSIAGEWAGFDDDWLIKKIQNRPSYTSLIWTKTVGRLSVLCSLSWRKIIQEIKYRRAN